MNMYRGEILRELFEIKRAQIILFPSYEIVYKHYKDSWLDITEGRAEIFLEPGQTKIFPVMLLGDAITHLLSRKKDSRLFNANKKMSFLLNINAKNYEYGLDRENFYEKYLNYMASYTARYKLSNF